MKKLLKTYEGLPSSIYVIVFAFIITQMGNFVGPFLTFFLTSKAGMSVQNVGYLVSFNALLGLIGAMIGGKMIDSIGRKKVLLIFRTLSGIGYAFCAFIHNPMIITVILLASSFFGGFAQPVFATMITDLTEGEQRKAAFSLNYIGLNIGYSVGPLLAGLLFKKYLFWFFLGDALTTFMSIALIMLFVPETAPVLNKKKLKSSTSNDTVVNESLVSALLKKPQLISFCFIIVIFFMVFSQFNFGLPLQLSEIFTVDGAKVFGLMMTANAVICSIFTVVITGFTKHLKPSLNISLGGFFYVVGFGMIFFISSFPMFLLSTTIWTIGEILIATNTSVYIADHTPITHRGRFNSVFPMVRRFGSMLGPIIGGNFARLSSLRNLWLFIGGIALVASLLMLKLYRSDLKVEEMGTVNKFS